VVGSAEDAIVATRLNANLQACVIRRRFAAAAGHDLSGLSHFADGRIASDLDGQAPDERAQILARRLARLRPELDLYLMTEIAVEETAGHLSHHFRRVSTPGKARWSCI
jgi:arginine decarboxylase